MIVLDIDKQAAQQTVDSILDAGGCASAYTCDVTDKEQTEQIVAEISRQAQIHHLVNSAGIAHIGTIEQTSEYEFDRLYDVNVKGVYNMLSAVIPLMKANGQGSIVNLASIAASVGLKDRFAYFND